MTHWETMSLTGKRVPSDMYGSSGFRTAVGHRHGRGHPADRRLSPCAARQDSDNYPSDCASDDSSGSGDTPCGFRVHHNNSTNNCNSSRDRKRSRSDHSVSREVVGGEVCSAPPKVVRQAANARERDRTHSVNSAFVTLRTLIPTEPADRKLSKIETLRLATSYISHLHTILLVGLDVVEQPCVKHHALLARGRAGSGGREGSENRPAPVCTFCLSASKIKNQPVRI